MYHSEPSDPTNLTRPSPWPTAKSSTTRSKKSPSASPPPRKPTRTRSVLHQPRHGDPRHPPAVFPIKNPQADPPSPKLRVAIDGISAAGKSTLARELTGRLHLAGAPAHHISADDFAHCAARRRRDSDRGRGYYRDALDVEALAGRVLRPLGPGGDGRFRARWRDVLTDELVAEGDKFAGPGTVVLVEGCFLQGPGLRELFDCVVWVATTFAAAEGRAVERDREMMGSEARVREVYAERYHAAGRRYVEECDPLRGADLVVWNEDVLRPRLEWRDKGEGRDEREGQRRHLANGDVEGDCGMDGETDVELKPVDSGPGA